MRNAELMKKVIELDTQTLHSREQSNRVMVQSYTIRKAFGVKNDEMDKPVIDYERNLVMTDEEITKQFEFYFGLLKWAAENNIDRVQEFKSRLQYFIDAVNFFNPDLAYGFNKIEVFKNNSNEPNGERKFKIGDEVNWTNSNGHNMGKRKVIGYDTRTGENTYYIDPIDTPWFSIRESNLKLYNPAKCEQQ